MPLRRKQPSPDTSGARAARRAQAMQTAELHTWAEQCTAELNHSVLELRTSEGVLRGEIHEARRIAAILDALLVELAARYV